MSYQVYLSGEIHTSWRDEIKAATQDMNIIYTAPVTDHPSSDAAGDFLGEVEPGYWRDQQSSGVNAIRTRHDIDRSDLVIVRFGDKYKQWNAAFDAGYATALGKSVVVMHAEGLTHALKEVDAAAQAVVESPGQVVELLKYVLQP